MWEYIKMTDAFEFIDYRGISPDKKENGIPLITAKNIKSGFISEEPREYVNEDTFHKWMIRGNPSEGDILFTTEAPLGNVALLPYYENVAIAQRIICFKPKKELKTKFYLWYILAEKFQNDLLRRSTGSTAKGIRSKELAKIKIPLPPLDQQKHIAQVLDAADELRQKNRALIEKYNELGQSLFLEMFGDVRKNEYNYPIEKLASICDVRDGTHDSPKYQDEGYPLVTSKNIKNGKIELENINYISKEDYDDINKRSKVDIGDIIMPMIGTIGNPLLVRNDVNYAIKNVALFKPLSNAKLNFKYLLEILSGFYFDEYVKAKNKGGTQKFISLGDLRNLTLPLPTLELQNEFAKRIEVIEKQKEQAEQSLKKSDELFNSLLQKAFRGELPLRHS